MRERKRDIRTRRQHSAREQEELTALIAEQAKDDQWGHQLYAPRVAANHRAISLDFTFEGGDSAGETIGVRDIALEVLTGENEPLIRRIPRPQKWMRHQIISHIKRWVAEHGEPPLYADWNYPNGRGVPSAASVTRRFGSWSAGIRAAGFEPRPVGGTRQSVQGRRRKRIRRQKCTSRLTSEQLAAAYVLYQRGGLDLPQLAARLWRRSGYSSSRACQQALWRGFYAEGFRLRSKSEARLNLPPEKRQEIARKAGMTRAKLTLEQVIQIRRSSALQRELAERYGVSQTTISRIKRRQTWGPAYFQGAA